MQGAILFVALAILSIVFAAQPYDYNCPPSAASMHAGCKVNTRFESTCETVQQEMMKRINGQTESAASDKYWRDPHNNGTYTLLTQSNPNPDLFTLQRVTGDGKYTDLINFVFGPVDNTQCNVFACSESQVTSLLDYGTNFCNIHDLYCAEAGCKPFAKLSYEEEAAKCTKQDASVCIA